MHRTLKIPELVVAVPVAISGLTCRTFQNPALDMLWRRQDTLLNFLKCFPNDLIETVVDLIGRQEELTDFRLLRPISNDDWTRPLFYCHRVQELNLQNELRIGSWAELPTQYFGAYMFPNLKCLQVYPTTLFSFENLELLLSPRIVRIGFDFSTELAVVSRIIPTLTSRCPSLTDIAIAVDEPEKSLQIVSAFVRSLVRVERCSVDNLDGAAYEHLGHLPSLKKLVLFDPQMPRDIPLASTRALSQFPIYSSLESLSFGMTTLEKITAFITIIARCPIQILEVEELVSSPTRDVAKLFFAALTAHCSPHSLLRINTGTSGISISEELDAMVDSVTFRLLFCFTNLVTVHLPPPFEFDLDDTDIREMARAWPRIESLELRCTPFTRSRITLKGLSFFAEYSPHLSTLEMDFDATSVPEWDVSAATTPPQTSLAHVFVEHCPIATPGPVAAFISRIFPNAAIDCWDDGLELGSEAEISFRRWQEVRHILQETRARGEDAEAEDAES
ncbi:hypothetical protein DFH09DRAFT_1074744 [Mycena vulgaris]|nr:hypothetical protein DFH09DRAFT_1074744 [Mycena vulgaris]